MKAGNRSSQQAAHANSEQRIVSLTELVFDAQDPDHLIVPSSVVAVAMIALADKVLTMFGLTAVSTPASCTALQHLRIATLMAEFAFDTVLSFDGLLIFLVSTIAVALFAFPLLTVVFVALDPGLALPSSGTGFWRAMQITQRRRNTNGNGFLQQIDVSAEWSYAVYCRRDITRADQPAATGGFPAIFRRSLSTVCCYADRRQQRHILNLWHNSFHPG